MEWVAIMRIERIVDLTNFDDGASLNLAIEQTRDVSEVELHYWLVCRDTLQSTAPRTRKIIALAQVEWERRKSDQNRNLAYQTTVFSSLLALFGVVLGAGLAYLLT